MRSYSLADGTVLVETGIASAQGLVLDDDGRFVLDDGPIEPRTFEHRAASGEIIATFGDPKTYALDDYFYILDVHYVVDGTLMRGTIEIGGARGTHRTRITSSTRVLELTDRAVLRNSPSK